MIDAEISLHKARTIVKEELLTYPTMIYQAELNSHLDNPSERKRANHCKENQEAVKAKYASYDRKNCNTESAASSTECKDLKKQLEEFQIIQASACDPGKIVESESDRAGNAAAKLAAVNASIKNAAIATEKILQSNCKAQDVRTHCKPLKPDEAKQLETFNRILKVTLYDVDKDCPRHPGADEIQFDETGGVVHLSPDVKNTANIARPPAL